MNFRSPALLFALTAASFHLHAHTFCVGTAAELTTALNSASSTYKNQDNEIDIKHGTYFGNWSYLISNTHGIVIRGGFYDFFGGCVADSQPNAALTVLDAAGSGTVFTVYPAIGVTTSGALTISDLTFAHGNEKINGDGGGLVIGYQGNYTGTVLIERNIFRNNTNSAHLGGGAGLAINVGGVLTIRNNLIYGNVADAWSGMSLFNNTGHANITNNTIAYNVVNSAIVGVAMVSYTGNGSAYAVFVNNIIAYVITSASADDIALNSRMTMIDNDIGVSTGTADPSSVNTVSVDPKFVDTVGGDFRLRSMSPMTNIGADTSIPLLGGMSAYDLDGNARVVGPAIDLGAYESDVLFADGFGS